MMTELTGFVGLVMLKFPTEFWVQLDLYLNYNAAIAMARTLVRT